MNIKVKDLEWVEWRDCMWKKSEAATAFGEYVVDESSGLWWEPGNETSPNKDQRPKIAAQIHFNKSVIDCLAE